ncbi:MAG: MEKHLA domain-containing protein [Verrucomicrobia bacterium]|nr:MEKHLA domain-containing protein [Verrucomicrobiota bacterium]MDE3098149.1 MEKHLA domain-containing protein [Verrucomicrobiota bacterium]
MIEIWKQEFVIAHTACLTRSFRHFTGRDLLQGNGATFPLAKTLFEAPFVVVSHRLEPDPILNYGNRAALELWEMSWEEFVRTPSRLTAEAPARAERARLLEVVAQHGFMDDYSGIRISRSGRRFRIERATVWNLISQTGEPLGQAATFRDWKFL